MEQRKTNQVYTYERTKKIKLIRWKRLIREQRLSKECQQTLLILNAGLKNTCSYATTPTAICIAWCVSTGTTLPLHHVELNCTVNSNTASQLVYSSHMPAPSG
jgi:hypothetical protein